MRACKRAAELVFGVVIALASLGAQAQHSVARQWNEELLNGIRGDLARPTVHARNLFHVSAATWDAWAAFDPDAEAWLVAESHAAGDVAAARREAISYAAYRILTHRFQATPGAATRIQTMSPATNTSTGGSQSDSPKRARHADELELGSGKAAGKRLDSVAGVRIQLQRIERIVVELSRQYGADRFAVARLF